MEDRFRRVGRRPALLLSSVALFAVVLAGCGTTAAPQGSAPASNAHKAMTTVSIQLNWLTNVEFSGLWIADHFGWFHSAGFKLKAKAWSNGISPEETTASCWQGSHSDMSKLCLGFDDSSAVPIARAAGNKLVAIWTGSQKTPFGFMTCRVPSTKCKSNTHKNITSPKQWKGLKIGYQSHELYVPEIMLGSVGQNLGQVTPVTVQFDTSQLTSGAVDAYLVFVNNEPIAMQLAGIPVNVIPAYKFGMGAFYADTMFAPGAEVHSRSAQLKTFVRLVDRGWKWAMAHPTKAADIVEKNYFKLAGARKQQQIEEGQFAKTLSRQGGKVDGQMTLARWKRIITILRHSKADINGGTILSRKISASSCFTNKFAPKPGSTI